MGRNKKKKIPNGPCAYCGQEKELTEDHVIPQCLFGNKVPGDIPIVYACKSCNNNQKSQDDVYLRDMLVIDRDASLSEIAQQIYHEQMARAIKRNQSAVAKDFASAKRVESYTSSGILVYQPQLPEHRIRQSLTYVIRGLSLSCIGDQLPLNTNFDIFRYPFSLIEKVIQEWKPYGFPYSIGDGKVFRFMYVRSKDEPNLYMWYLYFYERVTYLVLTNFSNFNLVY